ncbi:MAG: PAS domain S-box protein [Brevundimonas sp.]|nr:MAG: PAS domain S-box protein [Brevundimonas sp.]
MADLIRAHDWASTPLGLISVWPQSLKTMTAMLVSSPVPIVMLWGPEGVMIYNDAYSIFAGGRHPQLLGSNVREGWPEVADFNDNVMKVGLAGGTLAYKDQELTLNRTGTPEQVWMNLDYWPVPGEDGEPAGVIATVVETTARVVSDRLSEQARSRLELALSAGRGIGTWDWDVTSDRVTADARFARLYGADPDKARTGAPLAEFFTSIHPEDAPRVQADIAATLASGGLFTSEYRLIQPEGDRWVMAEGRATLDENGAPLRMAGVTFDIGERKRAEARQRALLDLNDAIRDLVDPEEIAHTSSQILAEALGVSRVGYGVMDTVAETVTIARDYNAPGIQSIAGVIHFRDFGSYIEDLTRGETVIFADAAHDPRVSDGGAALAGIRATSLINMPLMERGKVVALLFVNNATPREWSDEDLALVREVAERVRTASERARASVELAESEAQFRAFAQAVPNHVWASHPDGRLYWFNQQVYSYAGVEEGALDGAAGWGEIVHPDDLPSAGATWANALSTGEIYQSEFRIRRADGEWRRFAIRAEPVRDADGTIIRWVGANIDIEDIRQQGEELERVNDVLSGLLAGSKAERDRLWMLSQDMLARADYGGGMSAVNPAWTRILGWTEQELLTNPYADIINQDDLPATAAALEQMGLTGEPTRFENRILTKDNVWTPIGWTVAPEPDGVNFIAVGRDLTEDKAREAQLADAQEALRQSQKMEAVGQLTGGIAHDFNNLLAGISGSLELLGKRLAEGRLNGMDRYIDAAQSSAQRAAALTQRLLAFSRRQTLDPKPTDVNRLINGMEDLIRRSVGPDVEVEVVGAGGLWATRIDPSQLENALLNLCINARDAMAPDGGRLTIETSNKWLDDRASRERDLPPGQYVSLCVTDTGTGMSPEIQAQAFDPFFTTKPLGQGTGLGLSMIHGFVRQSGGQVRIYSEIGKGTTMCLYLPRYAGALDTPEGPDAAPTPDHGHGETVLVIDDEETVRMLVSEVLSEAGYHVIEAPDGPSGLEILRSEARIDLLVTDVGLPGGLNGRQVADAARIDRPELKVLFITGYAENAAVGNGLLAAGMEVLTKPFAMAALGQKVREMIEGVA